MTRPGVRCRSCGARVLWAHTSRGRRMPVDSEPAPGYGNVHLIRDNLGALCAQVVVDVDEIARRSDLHTAHHATCPHAREWRTRRRSTR